MLKMDQSDNSTKETFFLNGDTRKRLEVSLKDRVRVLLLRKGMSQNQLAENCGVSSGTMSEVVNEIWIPSASLMIKMAKELDCDSLVLFGSTEYWSDYNEKVKYPKSGVQDEA